MIIETGSEVIQDEEEIDDDEEGAEAVEVVHDQDEPVAEEKTKETSEQSASVTHATSPSEPDHAGQTDKSEKVSEKNDKVLLYLFMDRPQCSKAMRTLRHLRPRLVKLRRR